MGERHREPRAAVERRLRAELPPQPLERRVERIETGGGGEKTSVPVDLGSALLDAREMEEARREVVSGRQLATLDRLPRLGPVRDVLAEPQARRADHLEYPTSAPVVPLRNRNGARHRRHSTYHRGS